MKLRKTRKEKIIADLHRRLELQRATATTKNPIQYKIIENIPQPMINTIMVKNSYSYLTDDLVKTLILTSGIIIFEIVLFWAVKISIITLPTVSF